MIRFALLLCFLGASVSETPLYIGYYENFASPSFERINASYLAIDHLNAASELGSEYYFALRPVDDGFDPGTTFFSTLKLSGIDIGEDGTDESLLAIGGRYSFLSVAAQLVARSFWLPMISPSSTSPLLSDNETYSSFARVIPNDLVQSVILANIVSKYGWDTVAILFSTDEYAAQLVSEFTQAAKKRNITVVAAQSFELDEEDVTAQVELIKLSKTRVIFLATLETAGKRVIETMEKLGMVGPNADARYVLLVPDGISTGGANDWSPLYEGSIGVVPYINTTSPKFKSFEKAMKEKFFVDSIGGFAPYEYDATILGGKAIASFIKMNLTCTPTGKSTLMDLCTNSKNVTKHRGEWIFREIPKQKFNGVTGFIDLSYNGNRDNIPMGIANGKNGGWVQVGVADTENLWIETDIVWSDGTTDIPLAQAVVEYEYDTVDTGTGGIIALFVMAAVLIAFLVFLIVFHVIYRGNPFVKLSNPVFSIYTAVGMILSLCVVFVAPQSMSGDLSKQPAMDTNCNALAWLISLSYSLIFAPLIWKMHRFYKVFGNVQGKTRVFSTAKLHSVKDGSIALACLLLLDFSVLLFWVLYSPLTNAQTLSDVIEVTSDLEVIRITESCVSPNGNMFIGMSLLYKGLLTLYGVVLVVKCRNNDSAPTGVAIYTISLILLVTLMVVSFVENPTTRFLFISLSVLILNVVLVFLLYMPKVLTVLNGAKITGKAKGRPTGANTSANSSVVDNLETMEQMYELVDELKKDNERLRKALADAGVKDQ